MAAVSNPKGAVAKQPRVSSQTKGRNDTAKEGPPPTPEGKEERRWGASGPEEGRGGKKGAGEASQGREGRQTAWERGLLFVVD
jgi:hypothetical protein